MEYTMEQAKKDIKSLGIMGIETSGGVLPDDIYVAVKAVKDINLNFAELAVQAEKYRSSPEK